MWLESPTLNWYTPEMNDLDDNDMRRRLEAMSELNLGLSNKCLRRGTDAATSRLVQALEFAQKPTPVSIKLIGLIQYRLPIC